VHHRSSIRTEAIENLQLHNIHRAMIDNYAIDIWWKFTIENKPIPAESVSKLMNFLMAFQLLCRYQK
jgi:hypothetical protein